MCIFPVFGSTDHLVTTSNTLTTVAANIDTTKQPGLHTVTIAAYRPTATIGTFNFNGATSKADTIQFRREYNSDSALVVGTTNPLIKIRNWKTTTTPRVLKISNLAFSWTSSSSVLIDGGDTTHSLGSLILDSCVIYADTMSSTFIQWLADLDSTSHIDIKRSYIVTKVGNGTAVLQLQAPKVSFYNNVLIFPGVLQIQAAKNFTFDYNTCSRLLLNASSGTALSLTAKDTLLQNLIAYPAKSITDTAQTGRYAYFAALTNFNATVAKTNLIYAQWTGGFESTNVHFQDASNVVIPTASVPAKPDTSELWRWNVTIPGYAGVGAFTGDSARPNAYNVFPTDTTLTVSFPDNPPDTSAKFFFKTSTIPRTLKPAFTGAAIPNQAAFPADLFQWPGKAALQLNGPFHLNSVWLKFPALYGNPVLLAADTTGVFQAQAEGTIGSDSTRFLNGFVNAVQYQTAFRCNTPFGSNVSPTYDEPGFNSTVDTLQFTSITLPGQTLWTSTPASLAAVPPDLRYLGRTVGFTTTAVPAANSQVHIGSRFTTAPYLADSVKLWNSAGPVLYTPDPGSAFPMALVPVATPLYLQMVEHLSVLRGQITPFPFGWGVAEVNSDSGFQLWLDSTSKTVDPNKFGSTSKPTSLHWVGRGAQDSVKLQMSMPSNAQLWEIPANGTPVQVLSAQRVKDSLYLSLSPTDSGVAFFPGVSFNISQGTFNGVIDGYQVENLTSLTNGRLDFTTLSSADVDTISLVRYASFLGGASISMQFLTVQGTYAMRFGISGFSDPTHIKAYAYASSHGWQPVGDTLQSGDTITITGLDSSVTRVMVVEVVGPPQNIAPKDTVAGRSGDSALVTFSNAVSANANPSINGYQVEVLGVNPQGGTVNLFSNIAALTASIPVSVDTQNYNTFAVRYFSNGQLVGVTPLDSLPQLQVSKEQQEAARGSNTLARGWQLVGLPMGGVISSHFTVLSMSQDTLDQRQVWLLHQTDSTYSWDSAVADGYAVTRGLGALFGGSREYRLALDTAIPVNLDTFDLSSAGGGWQLISNPYPFPVPIAKLRSNQGALSSLKQLAVMNATLPRTYVWNDADTTLMPFTGFAYFFRAGEILTFDPLAQATLAKKSSVAAATPSLVLRLSAAGTEVDAGLFQQGRSQNIPALPPPGKSLDIRMGSGSGFWSKGVTWDGFLEKVIITSPASGRVSLSVNGTGSEMPQLALMDSVSGTAYTGGDFQNLPVSGGENHFSLVGGSAEFVSQQLGKFMAAFSNPGRFSAWASNGRLNLDFNLPATPGGYERLNIAVVDMRGRRILNQTSGAQASGPQHLDFALPRLRSGLYFCQIQAQGAGGARFQAARKVMLTP